MQREYIMKRNGFINDLFLFFCGRMLLTISAGPVLSGDLTKADREKTRDHSAAK